MADLTTAIEEWIARLPEPDFRALVARTRPPDEPVHASSEPAPMPDNVRTAP